MTNRIAAFALAGSLASALAAVAAPASQAADMSGKEKCYGVAMKGQNDCAAGKHDCAGKSTMNYDKSSFKLVPTGTCTSMKTPHGHGMLKSA
ncbi:BufA1 family periplasmic bufferin-type metallophore [Allorhizobium taibaishanense]|uniref:Putative membrane protein n=1 Tax=Allorhizobium taibaishanense TaxID=887144 RepID=A0A1Q9A419_9HYPH|nr:DUF2282 domain-containing protein [Allorhizobium taibaishanense]MBB4006368.1 putative membrane protein [Allorhizobium taibaishanense]OLP49319.1 hypothetical protein BJF91_19905 [Allorhizobium taibaishanense]